MNISKVLKTFSVAIFSLSLVSLSFADSGSEETTYEAPAEEATEDSSNMYEESYTSFEASSEGAEESSGDSESYSSEE